MNRFMMSSFVLSLLVLPLQAAQVIAYKDQSRQEATVSSKAFNRISIAYDRIKELVAQGSFDIETDELTGQVFLHPQPSKEPLYFTIISEKARVYELKLTVKNTEPVTLLIEDQSHAKPDPEPHFSKIAEIKTLPTVVNGVEGPWKNYETKAYAVMPRSFYRDYSGYEVHALGLNVESADKVGLFYGLTYRGEVPKTLKAEEFLKPGDLSVAISVEKVRPGQPFYLYVERTQS